MGSGGVGGSGWCVWSACCVVVEFCCICLRSCVGRADPEKEILGLSVILGGLSLGRGSIESDIQVGFPWWCLSSSLLLLPSSRAHDRHGGGLSGSPSGGGLSGFSSGGGLSGVSSGKVEEWKEERSLRHGDCAVRTCCTRCRGSPPGAPYLSLALGSLASLASRRRLSFFK